ncbi:MAG: hypothetical protein M3Y40_02190 [Chloroflexota bacterium]|nr:hypothetical protein [Chloroflexota bacterium]
MIVVVAVVVVVVVVAVMLVRLALGKVPDMLLLIGVGRLLLPGGIAGVLVVVPVLVIVEVVLVLIAHDRGSPSMR